MDLKKVGHTIQIAGVVYNSPQEQRSYVLMLPDEEFYPYLVEVMNSEQWKEFFWQTDVVETKVNPPNGEIIIRKSERQISQIISWNVFRRDDYTCRYCGKDDVPLTVDHVILWEDGGPSIEKNLVSSCKKCNQTRGNSKYENWLNSKEYKKLSKNISLKHSLMNNELLITMKGIPTSFKKMRVKR